MTKGIIIFAYNNDIDYGRMSVLAASLAKKHLKVPVSLITDEETLNSLKKTELEVFDKTIITEKPDNQNTRFLRTESSKKVITFLNSTRSSIWDLTPYDRTLLIDSDYLIFSDTLSNYWEVDNELMIGDSCKDLIDERIGILDKNISSTGIKMYWATTVMFSKTEKTKAFFDLVKYIKDHYEDIANLFGFSFEQYRNDISFSVAKHILDAYQESYDMNLPPILTLMDKDILYDIDKDKLKFLITPKMDKEYIAVSLKDQDIHIMNKYGLIENYDKLMEYACSDT